MEILTSIENFEESGENYREINSPRTLEACLRCGLDPSEVYPKPRKYFAEKKLTKEMIDIKYNFFEKKRKGKEDKNAIIRFIPSLKLNVGREN
jgi:hypothetical protein